LPQALAVIEGEPSKKTRILTAIALSLALAFTSRAQVPGIINYQGRIVDNGTNFNGIGLFEFTLVNPGGTTNYWSNDGTAVGQPTLAVSLTVTKGLYSVLLGSTSMTAIPPTVFASSNVLLRVWFNDGVNGFQQLTPDQQLGSVGYAMMAANVPNGAITSNNLAAGSVTGIALANGAVGTAQLANNLSPGPGCYILRSGTNISFGFNITNWGAAIQTGDHAYGSGFYQLTNTTVFFGERGASNFTVDGGGQLQIESILTTPTNNWATTLYVGDPNQTEGCSNFRISGMYVRAVAVSNQYPTYNNLQVVNTGLCTNGVFERMVIQSERSEASTNNYQDKAFVAITAANITVKDSVISQVNPAGVQQGYYTALHNGSSGMTFNNVIFDGPVIGFDPEIVSPALIANCAVTATPGNQNSWPGVPPSGNMTPSMFRQMGTNEYASYLLWDTPANIINAPVAGGLGFPTLLISGTNIAYSVGGTNYTFVPTAHSP